MATNFNKNVTTTKGGFKPSISNTPLDVRTRIATESDITTIPYPYIGMVIYVEDTGKRFEVLSLKDKKVGMTTQKLAAINEYRELKVSFNDLLDKPEIPSIEGLATEEFVEEKIAEVPQYDDTELREMINGIEVPSVEGLASEEFVRDEISKIPEVDLEPYAKKEDLFSKDYNDLENKPEIPSIEGLASEEFVAQEIAKIEHPQYDDSELREMIENIEVPSVEGLASEEFVREAIEAIEHPQYDDTELREMIEAIEIPEVPSIEGLASEEFVAQEIAKLVDAAPDAMNTLGELAESISEHQGVYEGFVAQQTEALAKKVDAVEGKSLMDDAEIARLAEVNNYDDSELRGMIENIEVPSVEGLASEEFVQQQIAAIEIPEVPAYQFKINTVEYGVEPSVEVEGVYPNLVFTFNMPSCIPPEPEVVGRMWYGYIPYDETGVNGVMEPDQINENMKRSDMEFGIAAGSLIEADPGVLTKYTMEAPACAFICTILPVDSKLVGYVDDGVGNKIKFTDMDISSGLAQDDCILINQIDEVSYRLSGLYVTNGGGLYTIYIDEK